MSTWLARSDSTLWPLSVWPVQRKRRRRGGLAPAGWHGMGLRGCSRRARSRGCCGTPLRTAQRRRRNLRVSRGCRGTGVVGWALSTGPPQGAVPLQLPLKSCRLIALPSFGHCTRHPSFVAAPCFHG